MKNTYQIYLISDSTGETIDRIFMALKAQFKNFEYELNQLFGTNYKDKENRKVKSIYFYNKDRFKRIEFG